MKFARLGCSRGKHLDSDNLLVGVQRICSAKVVACACELREAVVRDQGVWVVDYGTISTLETGAR